MARLPKKSFFGVLLLVGILMVTMRVTDLNRRQLTPIEVMLRDMLAPLQSGVTGVFNKVTNAAATVSSYNELNNRYQEMQKQLGELTSKLDKMEEYRQENARLRSLLGLKELMDTQWQMVTSRVIARESGSWYHTVTVNRGEDHGIRKNMPVINHQGLVGRVIAVTNDTAEVLLLIDPEGAVGGLVQPTRTPGIIEGSGRSDRLNLVHLSHDSPVKENQVVVTSGLGDIFPKGLRIGYVVDTEIEANGLVKQAFVRPFVDFDRLEELLIITGRKGGQ